MAAGVGLSWWCAGDLELATDWGALVVVDLRINKLAVVWEGSIVLLKLPLKHHEQDPPWQDLFTLSRLPLQVSVLRSSIQLVDVH